MAGVLRPCAQAGCRKLVEHGRCPEHAAQASAARGKTGERGYDWEWQQLRELKLATDPVCQIRTNCSGAAATEVDHIVPIRRRLDLRLEWSNLQSSCKPCNVAKAARDGAQMRAKRAKSGGTAPVFGE